MNFRKSAVNVMGVILVLVALCLGAFLILPYFVKIGKHRPQKLNCELNLKQIGLGLRQWAADHGNQYPFHVGTNSEGTRELVLIDAEGFDGNSYLHFMVASNELNSPRILVCPEDRSKVAATNFAALGPGNVTYRVNVHASPTGDSNEVLAVCPIDRNTLYHDGRVAKRASFRQ